MAGSGVSRDFAVFLSSMGDIKTKVFGIGFQKTGTTSLHHYLRRLGYKSIHWPHVVHGVNYQKLCIPVLHNREEVVDVLKPVIDEFEAFTDIPFAALYEELYGRMPDSRFILLYRDSDHWWESVARHWRLSATRPRCLDPYEYLVYNLYSSEELTTVTIQDKNRLKEIYLQHNEAVAAFFRSMSESLTVVPLNDSDVGAKICRFLGVESGRPFPAISRTSSVTGAHSIGKWR